MYNKKHVQDKYIPYYSSEFQVVGGAIHSEIYLSRYMLTPQRNVQINYFIFYHLNCTRHIISIKGIKVNCHLVDIQ